MRRKLSARKERLYAVACCRSIWNLLPFEESRQAILAAERYAEGAARERELEAAHYEASWAIRERPGYRESAAQTAVNTAARKLLWECLNLAGPQFDPARTAAVAAGEHARELRRRPEEGSRAAAWAELKEQSRQCEILRDLVGDPFHPAVFQPHWVAWRDGTVRKMSEIVYDALAFDRLPILADALEDAGCTDAAILHHCRTGGEHVRGCWVIDALLGKS